MTDLSEFGSIREVIDRHAVEQPTAVFLVDPENSRTRTFTDLQQTCWRLGRFLTERGARPGSKVALLMDNGWCTAEIFLGAMYAGFVVVPLNPRGGADQLAYTIAHCDAEHVFVERQHRAVLDPAIAGLGRPIDVIAAEPDQPFPSDRGIEAAETPSPGAETPALLMYTSGSTGRPKAATHTHASILAHGANSIDAHELTAADRSLLVLPLCHINAECVTLIPTLVSGGSVVAPRQFVVSRYWDWMAAWGCTWSAIVPTIVAQLLDWPDPIALADRAEAFAGIRFLRSSSAPLSPALHREFIERFGIRLIQAMGSSEAGNIFSNPMSPRQNKLGSPGLPWGFDLRIVADDGGDAPAGEPGEIRLRGPGMMREYYKEPEATSAALDGDGWFHTGDLAYRDADGYVFVVGRAKELIIKAGVNVSPVQVDQTLESHPAVLEAAAVAVPDKFVGEDIVALVIVRNGAKFDEADILRHCEDALGRLKTPSRVFQADELPKGPSGKVQRARLAERAAQLVAAAPCRHPAAPREGAEVETLQAAIADIWSRGASGPPPSYDANYFAIGGHSLSALQAIAELRRHFRAIVSLREFFEHPTVAQQARLVAARMTRAGPQADSATASDIPRRARAAYPLSPAQARIWFMDALCDGVPVYNEPEAARLRGPLDAAVLEQAFNVVVERHEILRTTVAEGEHGPIATVLDGWRLRLRRADLAWLPAAEREAELARLLVYEPRAPFRLAEEPALRATLIALGPDDHVLIVMMHHMLCDRTSMGVFWRELAAAYRAGLKGEAPDLPELPVQFGDYATWRRSRHDDGLAADLDYWERQLKGAPTVLDMPADRPRPAVGAYRGARKRFAIPLEVARALRAFARKESVTLFTVLASGLNALLFRYTDQTDISLGVPLADRDQPELEAMIAFLLHTHVLRTQLRREMTFRELLAAVSANVLDLHAHRSPTFDQVVERLRPPRSPAHTPLFQVMINWREGEQELSFVGLEGLEVESVLADTRTSKFDLTAILTDGGDEIWLEIEYSTDLFDEARIDRLVGHLLTLLASGAADPDQTVSTMAMLTHEERSQLLTDWNAFEDA
jgi:acyl-CoA synthetase (AMP-forming)/AMP-acid ligase II